MVAQKGQAAATVSAPVPTSSRTPIEIDPFALLFAQEHHAPARSATERLFTRSFRFDQACAQ